MQIIFLLIVILFALIEIMHKARASSPLKMKIKDYKVQKASDQLNINLNMEIFNTHDRIEVMIPSIEAKPILFNNQPNKDQTTKIFINNSSSDFLNSNNYWESCIVKSKESLVFSIDILIESKEQINLKDIWMIIKWMNYGPFGLISESFEFNIPIQKPRIKYLSEKSLTQLELYNSLPIKTHILGILDDPYDLLENYLSEIKLRKDDIITIGETPLAIMQGRYISPSNIQVSSLARFLCKGFHPTSSLATAYGMQSLIDIVGPSRVFISWSIGAFLKLLGYKGFFYRLAGSQARLIDDITGTTPPYDKSIVLGPTSVKDFCEMASKKIGINVAVVDVNDLGKVKILAASKGSNLVSLHKTLKGNPAGNANQQTPLVLIRPSSHD